MPERRLTRAAKSPLFHSIWLDLTVLAQSFRLTSTLLLLSHYSGYLLCIPLMPWNEWPRNFCLIWTPYAAAKLAETQSLGAQVAYQVD